jgi:hypothetical protein
MALTLTFDVIVLALLLWRQQVPRPVGPHLRIVGPVVLFVIGMLQLTSYSDHHKVSGGAVVLVFALGAALGALRGLAMRISAAGPFLVRRATGTTKALWVVTLLVIVGLALVGPGPDPHAVAAATLLSYVAVSLGVQAVVVHRRVLAALHAGDPIDVGSQLIDGPNEPSGYGTPAADPEARRGPPPIIDVVSRPVERPKSDHPGPPPA